MGVEIAYALLKSTVYISLLLLLILIKKMINYKFIRNISKGFCIKSIFNYQSFTRQELCSNYLAVFMIFLSWGSVPFMTAFLLNNSDTHLEPIHSKIGLFVVVFTLLLSYIALDIKKKNQEMQIIKALLITMVSLLIGSLFVYSTGDLHHIVQYQNDITLHIFPRWGVLVQPLGFLSALFMQIILRSRNRREDYSHRTKKIGSSIGDLLSLVFSSLTVLLFLGGYNTFFFFQYLQNIFPETLYIFQLVSILVKILMLEWFLDLVIYQIPSWPKIKPEKMISKLIAPVSIANIVVCIGIKLMGWI